MKDTVIRYTVRNLSKQALFKYKDSNEVIGSDGNNSIVSPELPDSVLTVSAAPVSSSSIGEPPEDDEDGTYSDNKEANDNHRYVLKYHTIDGSIEVELETKPPVATTTAGGIADKKLIHTEERNEGIAVHNIFDSLSIDVHCCN